MPKVRVLLVEHEGDEGPFGAKSVGEIAVVPTAAAVVNAINQALGTSLTDLPGPPTRSWPCLPRGTRPMRLSFEVTACGASSTSTRPRGSSTSCATSSV